MQGEADHKNSRYGWHCQALCLLECIYRVSGKTSRLILKSGSSRHRKLPARVLRFKYTRSHPTLGIFVRVLEAKLAGDMRATRARASRRVVTHAKHEFSHPLHEGMLLFNLISGVVEPHVVHGTLALTSDDFHNGPSNGFAGGISRVA